MEEGAPHTHYGARSLVETCKGLVDSLALFMRDKNLQVSFIELKRDNSTGIRGC